MSAIVGINHGAATTPIVFATTLVDQRVGYASCAVLYICTCFGSLFVSIPVVMKIGHRRALLLGMLLYSGYVGAFVVAVGMPMGSEAQGCALMPGSCAGGIAASLLWTAQGGYIDRSTTAILFAEPSSGDVSPGRAAQRRRQTTGKLTTTFAMYYLLFEVVCKLLASFALMHDLKPWLVFAACLGVCVVVALAGLWILDLGSPDQGRGPKPSASTRLSKATALWSDPVLWCLSLTNFTFGFSAAFMNGYVNSEFTMGQLGDEFVGFYATATAFTAAVMSQVFGAAVRVFGFKGPVILLGSLCFLAPPLLVGAGGLETWGLWLIVPYLLQGCGRAVYESTAKGVVADFFPGEQSDGAFANVMMQSTLSFGVCYIFSALISPLVLAGLVMGFACLMFPMYMLARWYRRAYATDSEALESDSSSTEDDSVSG